MVLFLIKKKIFFWVENTESYSASAGSLPKSVTCVGPKAGKDSTRWGAPRAVGRELCSICRWFCPQRHANVPPKQEKIWQ